MADSNSDHSSYQSLANDAICRQCQYPLKALLKNVCPECGTGFDLADRRTYSTSEEQIGVGKRLKILLLVSICYVAGCFIVSHLLSDRWDRAMRYFEYWALGPLWFWKSGWRGAWFSTVFLFPIVVLIICYLFLNRRRMVLLLVFAAAIWNFGGWATMMAVAGV